MVRVRDQAGVVAWAVALEAVRGAGLGEGSVEDLVEGLAGDLDVALGEAEAADSAGVKAKQAVE